MPQAGYYQTAALNVSPRTSWLVFPILAKWDHMVFCCSVNSPIMLALNLPYACLSSVIISKTGLLTHCKYSAGRFGVMPGGLLHRNRNAYVFSLTLTWSTVSAVPTGGNRIGSGVGATCGGAVAVAGVISATSSTSTSSSGQSISITSLSGSSVTATCGDMLPTSGAA
jgi:hypothetical protein